MSLNVTTTIERLTYLEAVNRVRRSCGFTDTATLTGADKATVSAMSAVKQACNEIWTHTNWWWKKTWPSEPIEMVATQMWYDLPGDFDEFDVLPIMPGSTRPLAFRDYGELVNLYPGLRHIPSDFSTLTLLSEWLEQTQYHGTPIFVTLYNEWMGLFPAPSAAFLDAIDNNFLPYAYCPSAPSLIGDSDELRLPKALHNALELLSSGRFKQTMEIAGGSADEQAGIMALRKATARHARRGNEEIYHHPGF